MHIDKYSKLKIRFSILLYNFVQRYLDNDNIILQVFFLLYKTELFSVIKSDTRCDLKTYLKIINCHRYLIQSTLKNVLEIYQ